MTSPTLALRLSQQRIDQIVLESPILLNVLGLPIENNLGEYIQRQMPSFQTVAPKKLKAFLSDCQCSWD